MRIFINGPRSSSKIDHDKFNKVAKILRLKGHDVYNVSELYKDLNLPSKDLQSWKTLCHIENVHLYDCDAIYMMSGWEMSERASSVYYTARKYGCYKFIYEDNGILKSIIRILRNWAFER